MQQTSRLDALREQHLEISRRILGRELRLECARILCRRYASLSDLGWLFSIGSGAAGTVLAVLSGQHANGWGDEVTALQQDVLRLEVERRLLEHEMAHLSGSQIESGAA